MTTRDIVPRADGEGEIGTTEKAWLSGHFKTLYAQKIENDSSGDTPDYVLSAYASWADAISNISTTVARLIVDTDATVSADSTVPTTLTVKIYPGCVITVATTKTLTINGLFEAGLHQVFDCVGSGVVSFGLGSVGGVYPEWWGVDGVADDVQINSAVNSITRGDVILSPNKTYYTTGTITINAFNKNLTGAGQKNTTLQFNPASSIPAVSLCGDAYAIVAYNKISGFCIDGTGNVQTKQGITSTNGEEILIEDINISNFTSTGDDCVGLQFRGLQTHTIRNVNIYADIPISIEDNPASGIDIDHYHFSDCYLVAHNNPCVNVASGVNLSHVTFDGYQAWVNGTHGFYWNDTTSTIASMGLSFKNIRSEQTTDTAAYMFYIKHNSGMQSVVFENIYGGLGINGFYLRKCSNVTFANVYYVSDTLEALNITSPCEAVRLANCFWQTGCTFSLGNMKTIYTRALYSSYQPFDALYLSSATENAAGVRFGSFTRDVSAVDGLVAYTGYGFQPSTLILLATIAGTPSMSLGFDCGTVATPKCVWWNGAVSAIWSSNDYSILLKTADSTYATATVSSFDSNGFTLSWAKTGSPTGTATILCLAFQ